MEDEMIDYYLIDYVIAAAFEEFPEVKEELEQCPFCYESEKTRCTDPHPAISV